MLQEKDFVWRVKRVNDIPSNHVDFIYVIVDTGEGKGKLYAIKMQPEVDETGGYLYGVPKYYIFCEGNVVKSDKPYDAFKNPTLDGYEYEDPDMNTVYEDLSKAMHRAYVNYSMIYGYVMTFAEDYDEKESEKHFIPHSDNPLWDAQKTEKLVFF